MIEIFVLIGVVWASIPLICALFTGLIHIWTRGRGENPLPMVRMQNWKYRWCADSQKRGLEPSEGSIVSYLAFDLTAFNVLLVILCALCVNIGLFIPLTIILSILGVLFIPRYFLDICNVLKYSFKTKESERISELERKLDNLIK